MPHGAPKRLTKLRVFALYASDGQLTAIMLPLAAAYVGSFATLGFQIGGG